MAAGQIDRKLPLPPQGRVPIKGSFDPQDGAVDAAKVLFLIVQGDGEDAVVVNGEGTWQSADGNEWRGGPSYGASRRRQRNGNASAGARPRDRSLGRHQAGHGHRRQRSNGRRSKRSPGAPTSSSCEPSATGAGLHRPAPPSDQLVTRRSQGLKPAPYFEGAPATGQFLLPGLRPTPRAGRRCARSR